jgi:hypothetical protein
MLILDATSSASSLGRKLAGMTKHHDGIEHLNGGLRFHSTDCDHYWCGEQVSFSEVR